MSCLGAFRTNLRMFRELCESTMRQSGPSPKGLRGVAELQALEALYAGERPFRGDLLKPLSAFCNLLVSGQLPGAFTRLNLGDACGALGEVLESRSTRRWRFDPDLSKRTAARLGLDPAEVRRRNFVQPEDMPYHAGILYRDGEPICYDSGNYPETLTRALSGHRHRMLRRRDGRRFFRGRTSAH